MVSEEGRSRCPEGLFPMSRKGRSQYPDDLFLMSRSLWISDRRWQGVPEIPKRMRLDLLKALPGCRDGTRQKGVDSGYRERCGGGYWCFPCHCRTKP